MLRPAAASAGWKTDLYAAKYSVACCGLAINGGVGKCGLVHAFNQIAVACKCVENECGLGPSIFKSGYRVVRLCLDCLKISSEATVCER